MHKTREAVQALAAQGLTATAIAQRVGVSRARVYQIVGPLPGLPGYRTRPARHALTEAQIEERRRQISSRQGRVAELAVASDLVARGYRVYWPLGGGGPDLRARRDGTGARGEVRAGRRRGQAGRWARPEADADLYAIVCGPGDILYRQG